MLRSRHYYRLDQINDTGSGSSARIEPVRAEEVREQLKLDHRDEDPLLRELVIEARAECETVFLGDRLLISGTCVDYFDAFEDPTELHWSPVSSISSVTYIDTDGDSQTLSADTYELGQRYGMGILRLKYDQSWPSTRSHEDVITVTYVAGYGTAVADVPRPIRRWIQARAAWLYYGGAMPWERQLDNLLAPYAVDRVFGGEVP
jgi:uncharacterized phiE125 gp8 family phage protein